MHTECLTLPPESPVHVDWKRFTSPSINNFITAVFYQDKEVLFLDSTPSFPVQIDFKLIGHTV